MEQIDFKSAIERLRDTTYKPLPDKVQISVPNAGMHLKGGLKYFCGDAAKWNTDYEKIEIGRAHV